MKVLIACECSGVVRDAFIARGHDAVSCDLEPSERPGPHIQGNVLPLLHDRWDMILAFPPCTDLSNVGARDWPQKQADGRQFGGMAFFMACYTANAPRIAVENPAGWMNTAWRKPDQIVNPFQFGHPVRKQTCLWLNNLPRLIPTDVVEPTGYHVSGQRREQRKYIPQDVAGNGVRSSRERARTFQGIADAMADQWGGPE